MCACTQDLGIAELKTLSEGICSLSLNEYQLCLGQKVVEDSRHGRKLTLGDYGIAARDTLVLVKVGSPLTRTNPKVDGSCRKIIWSLCFMLCDYYQ